MATSLGRKSENQIYPSFKVYNYMKSKNDCQISFEVELNCIRVINSNIEATGI